MAERCTFEQPIPSSQLDAMLASRTYENAWWRILRISFEQELAESGAKPVTPWQWSVVPSPDFSNLGVLLRGTCEAVNRFDPPAERRLEHG